LKRTESLTVSEQLVTLRDDPVFTITFSRPEKKNALTGAMYLAAAEALAEADLDPSISAVVFLGAGGAFTAGNDLADFLAASEGKTELPAFTFIKALAQCETPLIAAVEGVAIGIGATLLLHCDLVYAAPDALFRTPFVDLGLVPEAASSLLLPQRVGLARASEILLLGETFDAEEALHLGLINKIIASSDLKTYAIEQAKKFAAKPCAALAATRRLLRGDQAAVLARIEDEAQVFVQLLRSDDARAAFSAFLEKSKS
jgi:enoyl-CoA hydratase/carnithine racemase